MSTLIVGTNKQYQLSELAQAVALSDSDLIYIVQEIDGNPVSIAVNRSTFLAGLIPQGKEIISGGATYSGTGMLFNVSEIVYRFAGEIGTTAATDVTLNNGGALARIDAIVVNAEDNTIEVVEGTESANPATPVIAEEQIVVQYVFIAAGATTPTITEEPVYKEDVEWISSTTGTITGTIDFQSGIDPYEGSVCTFVDQCDKRARIRFTNASNVDLDTYTVAVVYVRFPSALASNKKLYVNVLDNGTIIGNTVNLITLGLDRNSTEWQQIVIPTSAFNTASIDAFQLRMVGGANNDNASWFIDNLILYTGFAPPVSAPTIQISDNGVLQGATSNLNFEDTATVTINTNVEVDGTITVSFDAVGGGGDFIPLTGTTVGNPVTGDIEFDAFIGLFWEQVDGTNYDMSIRNTDEYLRLRAEDSVDAESVTLELDAELREVRVQSTTAASRGLIGTSYFGANYDDNTYIQKKYVDDSISAIDLDDINDVPAYPNDGNDYVLVENNGVLTWELKPSGVGAQKVQLKAAWSDEGTDLVADLVTPAFTDHVVQPFSATDWIGNIGQESPTGQAIEFDIHKNGVSIFSTLPTIAAGATYSTGAVLTTNPTSFVLGDKIEGFITQVGSTLAGKGFKAQPIGTLT